MPVSRLDPVFRERCYGEAEGTLKEELADRFPDLADEHGVVSLERDFPGAETISEFYRRVVGGAQALLREYPDQRLAVVAHAGVLRMLLSFTRGIQPAVARTKYPLQNCEVHRY